MQSSATPASIEEYHAILREDFLSFTRKCFEHLNPANKLLLTWHLEALAYQIELIIRGDTKRLIVNIQPRSLKSFFFSIVLPAFLLGRFPTEKNHLCKLFAGTCEQTRQGLSKNCSIGLVYKPISTCASTQGN